MGAFARAVSVNVQYEVQLTLEVHAFTLAAVNARPTPAGINRSKTEAAVRAMKQVSNSARRAGQSVNLLGVFAERKDSAVTLKRHRIKRRAL